MNKVKQWIEVGFECLLCDKLFGELTDQTVPLIHQKRGLTTVHYSMQW